MLELTLKDLQYLKMHSPAPIQVGQVRRFYMAHGLATVFGQFHDSTGEAMEYGRMVGVVTNEGLKWKVECEVIL